MSFEPQESAPQPHDEEDAEAPAEVDTEPAEAPVEAPVEPSITLVTFASRFAWVIQEGMRRPAKELMAGFAHEERAAGRTVGKLADYKARWDKFRTRKV